MVDDTSAKFNKQDKRTYLTYSIAWHWRVLVSEWRTKWMEKDM